MHASQSPYHYFYYSKVGALMALAIFVTMVIEVFGTLSWPSKTAVTAKVVEAFIIAVTIIVVAIPEGLPLAVTM